MPASARWPTSIARLTRPIRREKPRQMAGFRLYRHRLEECQGADARIVSIRIWRHAIASSNPLIQYHKCPGTKLSASCREYRTCLVPVVRTAKVSRAPNSSHASPTTLRRRRSWRLYVGAIRTSPRTPRAAAPVTPDFFANDGSCCPKRGPYVGEYFVGRVLDCNIFDNRNIVLNRSEIGPPQRAMS